MPKGKNIIILLIGVAVSVIILGKLYLFGRQMFKSVNNQQPKITAVPTITLSPSIPPEQAGYIEGSMGFPSETIPAEVLVCAENQDTKQEFCSNKRVDDAKYTYHIGYKLEIPEGKYLVYEKMLGFDYRAYYSEFVTCGISVDCKSHEPIVVEVKAGETKDKIDPQDWYNQPSPSP